MAVFPEEMDRLDVSDSAGSLKRIENYIRYMTERVEFANKNTTRTVSEAGVSSVEVYKIIITVADTVAVLNGNMNILSTKMQEVQTSIEDLQEAVRDLTARVETLEGGTEA